MTPFAYIDPASGSLLIQGLIALLLGAGFYFRKWVLSPLGSLWRVITFKKPKEAEQQA